MKLWIRTALTAVVATGANFPLPVWAQAAAPAAAAIDDDAAKFGALELVNYPALSADGKRLVFVGPGAGSNSIAATMDLTTGAVRQVAKSDGRPMHLRLCDWSAADRLVCLMSGTTTFNKQLVPVTRLLGLDAADGGNAITLGARDSKDQLLIRQSDGTIIDWRNGVDGQVLMARTHTPQYGGMGNRTRNMDVGRSVDMVDTRTGKAQNVERNEEAVGLIISDGQGKVRIRSLVGNDDGALTGEEKMYYRMAADEQWRLLGTSIFDRDEMYPLAVDSLSNVAYVLQKLDGRFALYRYLLDGSLKRELVFASPQVDIGNVVTIGRSGRVIGASYVTERRQVEYFDPAYKTIAATLAALLPNLPLIHFISASADEQVLLVRASSDVDPGRYYVYDRRLGQLREVLQARPTLKSKTLSPMRTITYAAADGTRVPGYLTLPPGVSEPKGLPAIVMPHGGPGSRDEWGFDWLAQYFAQRGYVVLQPNFRGSAGYGDDWFVKNGFKSWKTSIGDICDGGRWLVAQGIADANKLAVFGWSYGGYAALQSSVVDPDLFKAVIAVAPVTDLGLLKTQAWNFTNYRLVGDYVGSGPHIREGSPAQQAERIKAPVLLIHGQNDFTVPLLQSERMKNALSSEHKPSELVVYPDVEHSLVEAGVRADMLRRSEAFLRQNLKP